MDAIRIRSGQDARLVNVSDGGLLIETRGRLLPGSWINLHLVRQEGIASIRGRVVRCAVARVSAGELRYHSAIQLEATLEPTRVSVSERSRAGQAGQAGDAEGRQGNTLPGSTSHLDE